MTIIAAAGLGTGSLVLVLAKQSTPTIATNTAPRPSVKPVLFGPVEAAPKPSPTPKPKKSAKPKKEDKPEPPAKRSFLWGITIQPFPFREQNDKFLPEQFRLANELGLKTVRVEYSPQNTDADKQAIDLAHQYHMQLVFVVPFGPNDIFTDPKLYENAYNYIADIVGKHVGQVEVWQLATEPASVAIIDGGHYGVDSVDYPEDKYQAVSTWLKAATKAVRDKDPNARRLVNDQWVHVGFFDRFLSEGGDFDILGWNWFSDMGDDWNNPVINTKTGQRYKLMNKLKSFKKDIWLTEINRRGGSSGNNEGAEADFIQKMSEAAYAEPAIKASLVYLLAEDATATPKEKGYSIMNLDNDKLWAGGPKEAFGRYQALIKAKQ